MRTTSRTEIHDRIRIPDERNHWRDILSNRRPFHRNNNVRLPSKNRSDSISYKAHVGRLVSFRTIVHFLMKLRGYGRDNLTQALKNYLQMPRPPPNRSGAHILHNEHYAPRGLYEDGDYGKGEHALQHGGVEDGYDDGLSYDEPLFGVSGFDV